MNSFVVHFQKHKHTLQHLMLMLVSVVIQIILPLNKGNHYTKHQSSTLGKIWECWKLSFHFSFSHGIKIVNVMFETELAVKHTPQDGTRIHIACYLFTVQVMPHLLVFFTHMHIL